MTQAFASDEERAAYETLAAEMKSGFRVDALWIKAMVEAGNVKVDAANLYARWRVSELLKESQDRRRAEAERIVRERATAEARLKAKKEEFEQRFPRADDLDGTVRTQLFQDWSAGKDVSARYSILTSSEDRPSSFVSSRSLLLIAAVSLIAVAITTIIMNS